VRGYLDINGNGSFDSATEPSATTSVSGAYTINNLMPGTYTARVDTTTLPAGYVQTFDADGTQDGGEAGISGVSVTLFDAANDTIAGTTTTNGSGIYSFTDLMPGTYYLVFGTPSGFARTISDLGSDATDSDPSAISGSTADFTLTGGQTNNTLDAGFYQPGTVSGHLYIDTNGDGNQAPGEPNLANVDVIVTDSHGAQQVVSTDANGNWSATVPPGPTSANVDESDPQYPAGHTQTEGDDPTNVIAVSTTNVSAGNDGYFLPGSISGTVLADADGDNGGDTPIQNVVLRLLDNLGSPVLDGFGQPVTTTTDANGDYSFGGLPPGDYCVAQDQPSGFASVSDTDGPNDNVIGNVTPNTVAAGADSGGNDFVETPFGAISGYVRSDDDNNGSGDTGLGGVVLNLLDSSGNPVLDGFGSPIQVATGVSGFYQFTLLPAGTYRVSQNQPPGYASVSDVDGANNNLIGDETPIVITPGLSVINRNFVEVRLGAISGRVFKDTNDDGIGDTVFPGITVALLDGAGNPVDGDPNASGVQPWSLVTGVDGSYRFPDLIPGLYQVSETQPTGYDSVSDVDGGNPDLIGNITPITVNPGQEVIERDFVEIELGIISGYVFAGASPLGGVTLTLLDENGDPVDGDPDSPGVQPVTTVTNGSGFYQFTGVRPGIYQVGQTQP
jgi:hypothetical protein